MESPMEASHLTLSDLERSKSRSLRFQSLISRKGAQLGPMLLLNINRKPYMGSPMTINVKFDLEWPWKVKVKVTQVSSGSRCVWYPYIWLRLITTLIWMSQKRICWRRGFSAVPAVFLVKSWKLARYLDTRQIKIVVQNICDVYSATIVYHFQSLWVIRGENVTRFIWSTYHKTLFGAKCVESERTAVTVIVFELCSFQFGCVILYLWPRLRRIVYLGPK